MTEQRESPSLTKRILDFCSISKIGDEAWLDIQYPGLHLSIRMTQAELRELLDIGEVVHAQLEYNVQPNPPKDKSEICAQ